MCYRLTRKRPVRTKDIVQTAGNDLEQLRYFVSGFLNGGIVEYEWDYFIQSLAYASQQNAGDLTDTGALVAKLFGSDLPSTD